MSAVAIGDRVPGVTWIATTDGRQFVLEDGVVVAEVAAGEPGWHDFPN